MRGDYAEGTRVIHNDAVLYGAPADEDTLGTVVSREGDLYRVAWDNGETNGAHEMDIREYRGGAPSAHQTDEEAADIAALGERL